MKRNFRIRNRSHRAFTLIELIAVMGCLSAVMGVAIVLLFQMFDLQVRSEEHSVETRSVNRLSSSSERTCTNSVDRKSSKIPATKTASCFAGNRRPRRSSTNGWRASIPDNDLFGGRKRRTKRFGERKIIVCRIIRCCSSSKEKIVMRDWSP